MTKCPRARGAFWGRESRRGGAVLVALAFSFGWLVTTVSGAQAASRVAPCAIRYLHLSFETNAGLGHGAYRVLVRNTGTSACALSGYARVRIPLEDHRDTSIQSSLQKVVPRGSVAGVSDTLSSYAGGYDGPSSSGTKVRPPLVVLSARRGVASFNIVWIEISPRPCPVSRVFDVGLAGATGSTTTHVMAFICSSVDVTPFVNGASGSWS